MGIFRKKTISFFRINEEHLPMNFRSDVHNHETEHETLAPSNLHIINNYHQTFVDFLRNQRHTSHNATHIHTAMYLQYKTYFHFPTLYKYEIIMEMKNTY